MSSQILDVSALIQSLPNKLPQGKRKLESPQDAITALIHTAFTILGLQLSGVAENSPPSSYSDNVLPEEWNQNGPSHYTLRYRNEQSGSELLVKVAKLGNRTLINSIATQSERTATVDIPTDDLVTSSFFPYDVSASDARPIVEGFISFNRVDEFISQFFKTTTIGEILPRLSKEVPTERADSESGPSRLRVSEAAPPARVQLREPPRPEAPPQPPHAAAQYPTPNPLEIGRRDRDPFPSNPFAPPSLFPNNGDEGMFVGPGHPIFGGGGMSGQGAGRMGPWGGDGFLPPMGAPPGARFDPVGPGFGAAPPFPGRGMPRRGNGPFGGQEPDFDDFPPPGSRDMFS